MARRHITRTRFADGSTVAELYVETEKSCPHCGAAPVWSSPRGDYRVCVACRRGWELERVAVNAIDNPALDQLVGQLERAG